MRSYKHAVNVANRGSSTTTTQDVNTSLIIVTNAGFSSTPLCSVGSFKRTTSTRANAWATRLALQPPYLAMACTGHHALPRQELHSNAFFFSRVKNFNCVYLNYIGEHVTIECFQWIQIQITLRCHLASVLKLDPGGNIAGADKLTFEWF